MWLRLSVFLVLLSQAAGIHLLREVWNGGSALMYLRPLHETLICTAPQTSVKGEKRLSLIFFHSESSALQTPLLTPFSLSLTTITTTTYHTQVTSFTPLLASCFPGKQARGSSGCTLLFLPHQSYWVTFICYLEKLGSVLAQRWMGGGDGLREEGWTLALHTTRNIRWLHSTKRSSWAFTVASQTEEDKDLTRDSCLLKRLIGEIFSLI